MKKKLAILLVKKLCKNIYFKKLNNKKKYFFKYLKI